ncbi:MAG: hypothetical protein JWP95_336 [Actinotalea sp.]|nr:hypothetical protein [Actinotalea sp.]
MHSGTDDATRVLVVDDHATFAQLLAEALDREPDMTSVGHATRAAQALDLVRVLHPDVVMMDVEMPDEDGFSATRRITAEFPDMRVIILTAHSDADFMRRAAASGACGFLTKDGSLARMLDTIRHAAPGSFEFRPSLDASASLTGARGASVRTPPPDLTQREREVLVLMGRGEHVRVIAERLGITEQTCRGYVKSILGKLGAHSQLQAVVAAWRLGLLRSEIDD